MCVRSAQIGSINILDLIICKGTFSNVWLSTFADRISTGTFACIMWTKTRTTHSFAMSLHSGPKAAVAGEEDE